METTIEVEPLSEEGPYRVTTSSNSEAEAITAESLQAQNPDEVIVEAGMIRLLYDEPCAVEPNPDFEAEVYRVVRK